MRLFIIYLNISVCFGHANLKKLTIYQTEPKSMGDNIGISSFRTLPYNAVYANSLILLYYALDPEHSVVSGFLCN